MDQLHGKAVGPVPRTSLRCRTASPLCGRCTRCRAKCIHRCVAYQCVRGNKKETGLATKPFPRRPSVVKQTTSGFAVAGIDNPLFTPNQPHASVTPKRASRRHRLNSKPTRTPQAARADRAGHRGPDSREITISGRCRVRPFGLGHIADGGALPLRWRHPTLARSEALGVERIMTLGLRSCGPSSPHQLSASRPCIRRRALC